MSKHVTCSTSWIYRAALHSIRFLIWCRGLSWNGSSCYVYNKNMIWPNGRTCKRCIDQILEAAHPLRFGNFPFVEFAERCLQHCRMIKTVVFQPSTAGTASRLRTRKVTSSFDRPARIYTLIVPIRCEDLSLAAWTFAIPITRTSNDFRNDVKGPLWRKFESASVSKMTDTLCKTKGTEPILAINL